MKRFFIFLAGLACGAILCFNAMIWFGKISPPQQAKELLYTHAYRAAVADAAVEYFKKFGEWPETPSDLVGNGFLPEWSEIFLPLTAFGGVAEVGNVYTDRQFVTNSPSGIIANVRRAPYYFKKNGDDLVIELKGEEGLFDDLILSPPYGNTKSKTERPPN